MSKTGIGMLALLNTLTGDLQQEGRVQLSQSFKRIGSRFEAFLKTRGKDDVPVGELDAQLMTDYEKWLAEQGVSRNTSSLYIRMLKNGLHMAEKKGLITGQDTGENIFKDVYVGIKTKEERSTVGRDIIRRLRKLDIEKEWAEKGRRRQITYFNKTVQALKEARDIFIFCVCAQGMDFVDVCFLRKDDLRDGTIHYMRRLSRVPIEVKVLPLMQEIIDRHKGAEDSPWLFDLLTATDNQAVYQQQRNALHKYHAYLKTLSKLMGLETPLLASSARIAWATAAYVCQVSPKVIAKAMGFASEVQARKFMATLRGEEVDKANEGVTNSIFE